MSGINFWDLYWPVVAALFTSVVVSEIFHIGFSYLMAKQQVKKYLEFQEKVKSGEIEVPPEMMGHMMGGIPGMEGQSSFSFHPTTPPTTASGEKDSGPGQYL